MITYSTNYMGPVNIDWFNKRGLTRKVSYVYEEGRSVYPIGISPGDVVEYTEVTTNYAGGRIDIRGLDPEEYWGGCHEYGLPIMHAEDWGALSHWLDHHKTTELWTYDELIDTFEKKCLKRKIRWADES